MSLGGAAGLAYFLLPRESPPWQTLFDRALVSSDEDLVARAHQRLWEAHLEGPGGAIEAFAATLRRDPASPYRWCELGEALSQAGRIDQARYCFRRGIALGPGTPSVLMRAANFHFGLGENRQALSHTARVLGMTPEFDQVIFSSYSRLGVGLDEALSHGLPQDRRAAQAFLRYLMGEGAAASTESVWRWVRAHSFADDPLADDYAAFLLAQRQYDRALQVWAAHFAAREPGFPRANRLFNGGFEREPVGRSFDWRVERLEGASIERDNATSAAGQWSLRIHFEGRENLEFRHVAQRAVVHSGAWRFQAQVRTADLSTDQGLFFQIVDAVDARRLDVRTEPLLGTRDWARVEATVVIPDRTRLVEVLLVRSASLKFDSKIRGAAWIDEVRLAPSR